MMGMTDREKVIRQFELAERMYKKNVASFDIENLNHKDSIDKQLFVKDMLETIEGFIKALLIWKGKTWDDAKTLGHRLARLYEALDADGKKILGDAFLQNQQPIAASKTSQPVTMSNSFYEKTINTTLGKMTIKELNDLVKNIKSIDKSPYVQEIGYDNGRYDGIQDFPGRISTTPLTQSTLMTALSKLNMPPMRYGNYEFNLTDEEIKVLYDFTAHLNTLTLMARGQNKEPVNRGIA